MIWVPHYVAGVWLELSHSGRGFRHRLKAIVQPWLPARRTRKRPSGGRVSLGMDQGSGPPYRHYGGRGPGAGHPCCGAVSQPGLPGEAATPRTTESRTYAARGAGRLYNTNESRE